MTQARATNRRTSLEKHQDEVVALLLTGWNQHQVAAKYKVHASSVHRFIGRHADILRPAQAAMVETAVKYAVASKEARLADLQLLRDKTLAVVDSRAGSLETKDIKIAANGETVSVMRYDAGLVAQWRGILDDAAKEMGERKVIEVNNDNRTVNYIGLVGQLGE